MVINDSMGTFVTGLIHMALFHYCCFIFIILFYYYTLVSKEDPSPFSSMHHLGFPSKLDKIHADFNIS